MGLKSNRGSTNTQRITRRSSKSQGGNGMPDPSNSRPRSSYKDPARSTASRTAEDTSNRVTPWGTAACSTNLPTASKRKNNEKLSAPDELSSHQLQVRKDVTTRPKDRCT